MREYPTQLKNPPIIESIVEIRFQTVLPNEAVFGVFYNLVKDKYSNVEQLPPATFPKEVLAQDESLKFTPHYALKSDSIPLTLMIGPKVITFKYQKYGNTITEYPGWNKYMYSEIVETLSKILKENYIQEIVRVGLRAIDFMELDIFKKLKINISMETQDITNVSKNFKFRLPQNNFDNSISISNSSILKNHGQIMSGSTIDIDTFVEKIVKEEFLSYLKHIIATGHTVNKNLFFELLQDKYISDLEKGE